MALWRRFQTHIEFPIIRIDDRLIHGQVILGWVEPLRIRKLILAHNRIADDQELKTAIAATVPPNLDFSVAKISDSVPIINHPMISQRLMVVVESPQDVAALREQGGRLKSINIGGLHYKNGRTELLPYVFITPNERQQIDTLVDSGVNVTCQDLPGTPPIPWKRLTEKLGKA
jgi:PTS system mannose-specific IIB component